MIDQALLYEASLAWCPDFPRQATYTSNAQQDEVKSRVELKNYLASAAESGGPGYSSVYSFPRGHSKKDNIPKIDTVFFDLDIPTGQGSYDPKNGGSQKDWERDMSKLLVRARMIAKSIREEELGEHFRVAYSGHKGIHLYIDFGAINPNLGEIGKYKNGIANYADELIDYLADAAGVEIHEWMDVTSHDLGRLARHPNTPHHGAAHVDWTPYCVPGSIEELADLTVDDYLKVTRGPRKPVGSGRVPSSRTTEVLTENIKDAPSTASASTPGKSSYRDQETLDQYTAESNDAITVETVRELLIQGKPCIEAWVSRDDAYEYGQASRRMEIEVIKELSSHQVPIDVMVEFFSDIPHFDEDYTQSLIKDVIARYYPTAFVCSNVVAEASGFCLGDDCSIYEYSDDLEK